MSDKQVVRGTSRVTLSPAKFLNDARRTTALAERRAEPKGCGSLGDVSVRTNKREELKPTIAATSNPRLQRDEPDPERGHVTTHNGKCIHDSATKLQHDEQATNLFEPTNTPSIHSTHSHHLFTLSIHITHSHHLFTSPIHTTYSHRMFTLAQPTATSSRSIDEVDKAEPAHHGSTARRRTQPEKCGGKRATEGNGRPPGLGGAEHGSRSMSRVA